MAAIGEAKFGDIARTETGGKGLDGVAEKAPDYFNPLLDILENPKQGRIGRPEKG